MGSDGTLGVQMKRFRVRGECFGCTNGNHKKGKVSMRKAVQLLDKKKKTQKSVKNKKVKIIFCASASLELFPFIVSHVIDGRPFPSEASDNERFC